MPAFPTLTKAPSYPLDPDGEIEDVILRSDTTAGYEQARPRFTRARRVWGLNYPDLPSVDESALRTFELTTLRNGADKFTWNHPVSGSFTVRLMGPIKFAKNRYGGVDVSFKIREQ
jgi:hypothetical protein